MQDGVRSADPVVVSVVVPVLNERDSLRELHRRLDLSLRALERSYEILFVDDGSDDGSLAVMEDLQGCDPHVRIVEFRRNFGKSAAYQAAFQLARGEVVITLDADLQDRPEEIGLFLEALEQGHDLVVGWRYSRQAGMDKTLPSRVFNRMVRWVSGLELHDFNSPFKAYRREVLQEIDVHGEQHRYIPLLAHARGFRITEIRVENQPRKHGNSKYGVERYLRGFLDLLTVMFVTRFAQRPLHFLGLGGVIACFLGGAILSTLVGAHFLYHLGVLADSSWNFHDRPAVSLGVLLLIVGVQFFSIGLLAELVVSGRGRRTDHHGYSIRRVIEQEPGER